MSHKLDPVFYSRLQAIEPVDVCRRSLAQYNEDLKTYSLTVLGQPYEIDTSRQTIVHKGADSHEVSADMGVLILNYMIGAREIPLAEQWVNEFSLKGGAMFFRGLHAIPNLQLAGHFGKDLEGFKRSCLELGGESVNMGDAAFRFQVLPRIPVIIAFWFADEEFDASAKLLMDPTIQEHLPLDAILGLGLELYGKIIGNRICC
jgi:hypothetical protein